ncbi:MAG: DUF2203 domain-containing protein [Pyrinomonadaceae bacterium]|nr:DUF2203 domain-containing protein [Pyrinomonadaceae bacterium]
MKLFTVEEANAVLPSVIPKLLDIRELYAKIEVMRDEARTAAAASQFGGGMPGGTTYVNALYQVGKLTTELGVIGVELKDYSRGLIDFPCMRNDRIVLLCWQIGDGDEIAWWHETDAGFAGRKPL